MSRRPRRYICHLAVLAVLLGTLFGLAWPKAANAAPATTITVDGTQSGRTFDGVGAISGGGGNSRLLADYPERQRGQILDYLFKPGYGASLQMLKVEIGGDTNSTDGAEASHMHTRDAVDCEQGYEWWMAKEAKKRNPDIKLAALSWGAPGWIGNGNFWSQDMIDYLMEWMGCAKKHGLTIDYMGGWNERGYDKTWYVNLKNTLKSKGYKTKVVASDSDWKVVDDLASDPAFNDAVDSVGVHYPCGYLGDYKTCDSPDNAKALDKPLWASENGSEATDEGAPAVARALNRDYIDGKMTGFFNWPVIAALYPNLFFSKDGMSIANEPWSGAYHIGKTTWVTAHTTQFTKPGWQYIDSASGYLGDKRDNGSYVSLKSGSSADYTSVIETIDATEEQTVTFKVAGGLSQGQVHVWGTDVKSDDADDWFVKQPDVDPSDGSYTLTLRPGHIYTVTTTSTGGKGTATSPQHAPLKLPYADDFETPATTTSPKYFTDMNGAFKTVSCGGGREGTCVRQMAAQTPIRWTDEPHNSPYTITGDGTWDNYTVSVDTMLEKAGSVEVLGRVNQQAKNNNGLNAYHLRVSDTGQWSILKSDTSWKWTKLAEGIASGLGTNKWHTVALSMKGSQLTASIDGRTIGTATDTSYSSGQPGLSTIGYDTQQFDNFKVTPANGKAKRH